MTASHDQTLAEAEAAAAAKEILQDKAVAAAAAANAVAAVAQRAAANMQNPVAAAAAVAAMQLSSAAAAAAVATSIARATAAAAKALQNAAALQNPEATVAAAVAEATLEDSMAAAAAAVKRAKQKKREEKERKEYLGKLKESANHRLGQVFIIMNLYYYFQGVILVVSAALKSPQCHRQAIIFYVLSAIPFGLHFIPLVATAYGYCKDVTKLRNLKLQFENFRKGDDTNDALNVEKRNLGDYLNLCILSVSASLLILFNISVMYAFHSILCWT